MEGASRHSRRADRELCRHRRTHRRAEVRTRGRAGLRRQCTGGGHPLPPGSAKRRLAVGLSMGRRAKAHLARTRGVGMNARDKNFDPSTLERDYCGRIAAVDWSQIGAALDAQGAALIERLTTPAECRALAALYPRDEPFRSRVLMARHGFGRGEYKYFRYPLPELIASLREAIYRQLAPIANCWYEAMSTAVRFPDEHAEFISRCHAAGQQRPTPL